MEMWIWLIALQGAIPSFVLTHTDVIDEMLHKRWSVTTLILLQLAGVVVAPNWVFSSLWIGMLYPPTSWAVMIKVGKF